MTYPQLRSLMLCVQCRMPAVQALCPGCSAKNAAGHRMRYASARARLECVDCSAPTGGPARCRGCQDARNQETRARKSRGIYQCSRCLTKGHNARTCEQ